LQGTEGLIGFFVNTLVLRGGLKGNPAFTEYLKKTRETTLEAYAHQEMPFDQLVDVLKPERSLTSTPWVQVMFALQNVPMRQTGEGKLVLKPLRVSNGVAKFDLSVIL